VSPEAADGGQNDGVAVEKWTPERRRQLTRDTLIEAAAAVFARRGFHGASLDEIAETAGFTRGAIYKNFDGKEDLFLAVNTRLNERALRDFAEFLGDGRQLENVDVASVAKKWREIVSRDRDFFVLSLEFHLYALRNPEVKDRALAQRRETTRLVARLMEKQSAEGGVQLPMPVEDLANIFLITSDGFTQAADVDPDATRLYERFLELLIAVLAGAVS
jgi:AcrR family transcriptional regulator